jgi:hypothetical protein
LHSLIHSALLILRHQCRSHCIHPMTRQHKHNVRANPPTTYPILH